MLVKALLFSAAALPIVLCLKQPCPSKQQALQASAENWPTPTAALGSYFSSYSSAQNGVFSCSEFVSDVPATLTSSYSAWYTSVSDWSTSLESTISAAQSTCQAFVVNIVIVPFCTDDAVSQPKSTAASSSTGASQGSSTSQGSSGARSLSPTGDISFLPLVLGAGIIGALAIVL